MSVKHIILVLFFGLIFFGKIEAQTLQHSIQQGMTFYELKEYENAIQSFEQSLLFQNPPRDVYTYLTSSYLLIQQPEKAVEIASEGLEEYPDFLRLKVMKGEALIHIDVDEAIVLFQEVDQTIDESQHSEIDGITSDIIQKYLGQLYQRAAALAFQNEELEVSSDYYYKAREIHSDSLSIHNNLAYILIQQEKWDDAEEAVNVGIEQFPEAENLLLMKAQIAERNEDSEQMVNSLESLYRSEPVNMDRAILYGKALLKNNEAEKANLFFQQMINDHPKERSLYRALVDINRQRFNQAGLLQVLEMEKEQFPNDRDLLEEYGTELITAQKYEMASTYFDSLAVEYDEVAYAGLSARAWLYDREYEAAEEIYRKQLDRWPDDSTLLADFGRVLNENGKHEKAKEIFRKFLEENENSQIRIEYARLLDKDVEKEEVLEPLKDTIYQGWAEWILLKDQQKGSSAGKSAYTNTLNGMIELYESRQEVTQEEVQFGLNQLRAKNPPIFQNATELKEISSELQDMFVMISDRLSFEDALEVLHTGLEEFEESTLLYHQEGLLFYEHEKYTEALKSFESAARTGNADEETHLYLGHVYSKSDRFNDAVLSYERVLTLDDQNEDAYRSLVRIHQKNGKLDELCGRWLQRYNHQKQNPVLREFLIDALHRANQFEEVRALLD
ncbi:hypothetical protein [Rhodohalobacter sp. 614A]|uniref:hypothetical protein n=1 Tax=Rhodohalobacter sp. 614A TaxID=2908649 RepID=UPI001F35FF7D|nr:hypothetical protein [Rhodohalobacter sp. 614A]